MHTPLLPYPYPTRTLPVPYRTPCIPHSYPTRTHPHPPVPHQPPFALDNLSSSYLYYLSKDYLYIILYYVCKQNFIEVNHFIETKVESEVEQEEEEDISESRVQRNLLLQDFLSDSIDESDYSAHESSIKVSSFYSELKF